MTTIEWTDTTWNPVRGCSLASAGCTNCYAMRQAHRFSGPGQPYEGLTRVTKRGPVWTGEVRVVPELLAEPLKWRKPRRVFVNSMSDLFHKNLPFEFIAAVFGVMAAATRHTFQVLTKRPERAREFFAWVAEGGRLSPGDATRRCRRAAADLLDEKTTTQAILMWAVGSDAWPLPNVHLGVSVEDQATADERIPPLLQCPAAVRFVSYEPALEEVNFSDYVFTPTRCNDCGAGGAWYNTNTEPGVEGTARCFECNSASLTFLPPIDWLIIGGESGPSARPFDIAWARDAIAQCAAAAVPVFVKQLGARPYSCFAHNCVPPCGGRNDRCAGNLKHRKGADPTEWPDDLRVREWPEVTP